jgi:hypothetical protein
MMSESGPTWCVRQHTTGRSAWVVALSPAVRANHHDATADDASRGCLVVAAGDVTKRMRP